MPSRRATSSSLPPLSATESTAEEDDDASASPLATLGRLATSVLHVARAMPATGVSASTVSLAVRSFALRHGGDSDLSVSTTAALGPSGLSESDGRTVRPVATAGSGQDSPASEAPPLRYGVASTGDRSSPEEGRRLRTDDQPSPGDDGSTPPKGSRDSDRTPDEESRPSVPPDRQTAGVLSERLDRERPETPERTATSRREQRSDPDGPEKDTSEAPSLPTLSDIGLDVDEDGVVEERGLSTAADRDVQRLYRAFRRRLRTERRRRGL